MLVVCSTPELGDIAIELGQVFGRRAGTEQFRGDARVPLAQIREPLPPVGLLCLGQAHQLQQRVGNALAGRQHDRQPRPPLRFHDARDALETARIGDAGAAKLVHHPGLGVGPDIVLGIGNSGPLALLGIATKKLWHTTSAYPIPAICQIASRKRPPQAELTALWLLPMEGTCRCAGQLAGPKLRRHCSRCWRVRCVSAPTTCSAISG